MNKTCPLCGEKEKLDEFIQNFCQKCFAKQFSFSKLPERIPVNRCSVCGRIKFIEWTIENAKKLLEIIASKVKSPYSPVITKARFNSGRNFFDVDLKIEYEIDGKKVERSEVTKIVFEQTQCHDCSKQTGGYYDAIIQIRNQKDDEVDLEQLESKSNKLQRLIIEKGGLINKIREEKTGIDLLVSGITPALQASHSVNAKVKHTRKLVGQKKGKELFRHTFCLRF